jgi:hypothetical protein
MNGQKLVGGLSAARSGGAVIARAPHFNQSLFVSHHYIYVIFDRYLRHVSIHFSKVDYIDVSKAKSIYLDERHVLVGGQNLRLTEESE